MDISHYDKCRTMMLKHRQYHKIRVTASFILLMCNLYLQVIRIPLSYNRPYLYGVAAAIPAIVLCIGVMATSIFATQEKPKLLITVCIMLILGMLLSWIHPIFGIILLTVWLSEASECKQAVWIQKQEGYPYFSERFSEQMQKFGKEYQPEHQIDNVREAEMPDIPELSQDTVNLKK